MYAGCSSVVHISKELFHWGDTYTINILNPEDEIPALMLVIAIDAANCTQENKKVGITNRSLFQLFISFIYLQAFGSENLVALLKFLYVTDVLILE